MSEVTPLFEKYISRPRNTAVLAIDIQRGYADPKAPLLQLFGNTTDRLQGMIPPLGKFLHEARLTGIPVFWTQMAEDPTLMVANMREKMLTEDTPALTTPGDSTYDFMGISPKPGDRIIHKRHYNAFTDTDLDEQLKKGGIDTLIITGAYASRCVASTAIVASDVLGYRVLIPEDLVEGDDSSVMVQERESFLNVVRTILGETATSEQIIKRWKQYQASLKP